MLRFYASLVILLIVLFVLFGLVMTTFGKAQPLNPALRGFVEGCEDVPQPCWYGVRPGITTVNEFGGLLRTHDVRANNSNVFCNISHQANEQQVVIRIELTLCKPVALIEVLTLSDVPTTITQLCGSANIVSIESLVWSTDTFTMHSPIRVLRLFDIEYNPARNWRGFAPVWRYVQLEPSLGYCGIG